MRDGIDDVGREAFFCLILPGIFFIIGCVIGMVLLSFREPVGNDSSANGQDRQEQVLRSRDIFLDDSKITDE